MNFQRPDKTIFGVDKQQEVSKLFKKETQVHIEKMEKMK